MSMKSNLAAAATLLKTAARNKTSFRQLSSKPRSLIYDEDDKLKQRLPIEQSESVPAMMVDPFFQDNVEQLSLLRQVELNKFKNPQLFRHRDEFEDAGRVVFELRSDIGEDLTAGQSEVNKLQENTSTLKKLERIKVHMPYVFASGVVAGVSLAVFSNILWKLV